MVHASIHYYLVAKKKQPGEQLLFTRFAVRGTEPLSELRKYINEQREKGRFVGEYYISYADAHGAPFPPRFDTTEQTIFEYPVENGTGRIS